MSLSKVSKRPARWIDMVAGSERMLRVHHKNMVHFRNFQHNINDLDATCRKNVNKLQQEIYDIYYGEFLSIKEQSDAIRFPQFKPLFQHNFEKDDLRRHPNLENGSSGSSNISDGTRSNSCMSSVILPAITCNPKQTKDKYSKSQMKATGSSSLAECSLADVLALPPIERNRIGHLWRKELEKSLPVDSDSDVEETPRINSAKLQIIKKAVALTSQPSLHQEKTRKSRALRESFLLNLRRQREKTTTNVCSSKSVNKLILANTSKESKLTKTRPDLSKNKIFNEIEDEFESCDRLVKHEPGSYLSKELSSINVNSSSTSVSDLEDATKISTSSSRNGHDSCRISNNFDDFDFEYENSYSETPDFFNEIDEDSNILDSSDLYSDITTSTFSTHSSDVYDSDDSTSVN